MLASPEATSPTCQVCSGPLRRHYETAYPGHHLWRCLRCSCCETWPRVSQGQLASFYQNDYFHDEAAWKAKNRLLAGDYLAKLGPALRDLPPSGSVLEVGGGYGYLAELLARRLPGVSVSMLEPSRTAARFARDELGVNVLEMTLEDLPAGRRYDLVFAGHVLEHFPDAESFFGRVVPLLAPGGRLVCLLPNATGARFLRLGRRWRWACPEQHLQFLSGAGAGFLARRYGLTAERVTSFVPHPIHYPGQTGQALLGLADTVVGLLSFVGGRVGNAGGLRLLRDGLHWRWVLRGRPWIESLSRIEWLAERTHTPNLRHDELMFVLRR